MTKYRGEGAPVVRPSDFAEKRFHAAGDWDLQTAKLYRGLTGKDPSASSGATLRQAQGPEMKDKVNS